MPHFVVRGNREESVSFLSEPIETSVVTVGDRGLAGVSSADLVPIGVPALVAGLVIYLLTSNIYKAGMVTGLVAVLALLIKDRG